MKSNSLVLLELLHKNNIQVPPGSGLDFWKSSKGADPLIVECFQNMPCKIWASSLTKEDFVEIISRPQSLSALTKNPENCLEFLKIIQAKKKDFANLNLDKFCSRVVFSYLISAESKEFGKFAEDVLATLKEIRGFNGSIQEMLEKDIRSIASPAPIELVTNSFFLPPFFIQTVKDSLKGELKSHKQSTSFDPVGKNRSDKRAAARKIIFNCSKEGDYSYLVDVVNNIQAMDCETHFWSKALLSAPLVDESPQSWAKLLNAVLPLKAFNGLNELMLDVCGLSNQFSKTSEFILRPSFPMDAKPLIENLSPCDLVFIFKFLKDVDLEENDANYIKRLQKISNIFHGMHLYQGIDFESKNKRISYENISKVIGEFEKKRFLSDFQKYACNFFKEIKPFVEKEEILASAGGKHLLNVKPKIKL